jgi:hypothetical protein
MVILLTKANGKMASAMAKGNLATKTVTYNMKACINAINVTAKERNIMKTVT